MGIKQFHLVYTFIDAQCIEEEIDGDAFLLMSVDDIVSL